MVWYVYHYDGPYPGDIWRGVILWGLPVSNHQTWRNKTYTCHPAITVRNTHQPAMHLERPWGSGRFLRSFYGQVFAGPLKDAIVDFPGVKTCPGGRCVLLQTSKS